MEMIVEKKKRRTKEQVLADKAKAEALKQKKLKVQKPEKVVQPPLATKEVPLIEIRIKEHKKTLWEKLCFWK